MENQHRKISGYRELSQEEIDLMNEIKTFGPQFQALLEKIDAHHARQEAAAYGVNPMEADPAEVNRLLGAQPKRWKAIAATHLQEGLMALTRSVAQPTFF